jgi:hypothetical protein
MSPLFDAVVRFFEQSGWKHQRLGQLTALRSRFRGASTEWDFVAHTREEESFILFYSIAPVKVPVARRAAAAEFVARANWGLSIGNFELDMDDGEVRFKTAVDVEGTPVEDPLLQALLIANLSMMDKYLAGLTAVVSKGKDPKGAVQEIEGASAPTARA